MSDIESNPQKAVPPPSSGSALARRIATAILTIYDTDGGTECTRAQMMLKQSNGTERNMGGRNKASIVEEIDRLLVEHAYKDE